MATLYYYYIKICKICILINTKFNVPYSFFNYFRKALFFDTFILSLYLLTMSFANEKHLTLIYNLIKFSKRNDLHSLEISMSQFSTMLSHA